MYRRVRRRARPSLCHCRRPLHSTRAVDPAESDPKSAFAPGRERQFLEHMQYSLLVHWFVAPGIKNSRGCPLFLHVLRAATDHRIVPQVGGSGPDPPKGLVAQVRPASPGRRHFGQGLSLNKPEIMSRGENRLVIRPPRLMFRRPACPSPDPTDARSTR